MHILDTSIDDLTQDIIIQILQNHKLSSGFDYRRGTESAYIATAVRQYMSRQLHRAYTVRHKVRQNHLDTTQIIVTRDDDNEIHVELSKDNPDYKQVELYMLLEKYAVVAKLSMNAKNALFDYISNDQTVDFIVEEYNIPKAVFLILLARVKIWITATHERETNAKAV